jgi:hypothetical protein
LRIRDIDETPITWEESSYRRTWGSQYVNGYRRVHDDGSQSLISHDGHLWSVKLLIPHRDGDLSLVGPMTSDLDEAKALCEKALEKENSHVCTRNCQEWEPC